MIHIARRLKRRLMRGRWQGRELKVQLGSGLDYRRGYVNVDADPKSGADLMVDFRRIGDHFEPGTVAEFLLIHSLPYLFLWEARDLFRTMYDLLRDKGLVVIEFPDVSKEIQQLQQAEGDLEAHVDATLNLFGFSREHLSERKAAKAFCYGWAGWHLKGELEDAGFRRVELLPPQTHGRKENRDSRIEALK